MTPETMARLHAGCFPERPWTAREIEELLRSDSVLHFASPGGDGLLMTRLAPPEAEILTLAVDPDARRRGTGFGLVGRWIDEMARRKVTDLYLEVAADNIAALALYERHGFRPTGRRPGYYARPETGPVDAVLMHRALPRGQAGPGPRIG